LLFPYTTLFRSQKGSANGTMFHMLRGSNDCIYTTIGHEVLEFNLLKRRWTANKPIDGIAMSFTESPDGKIYFGTYPKSTLWEFRSEERRVGTGSGSRRWKYA